MKLILSRKGFDSSAGGVPSPIFPNGRLVSLPIPDAQAPLSYAAIKLDEAGMAPLVEDLSRGKVERGMGVHLDPDLHPAQLPRLAGWRPQFGQMGAAEGHLRRRNIQAGDLFLFFGWFRKVERRAGIWTYQKGSQDLHVVYGWLQVAQRIGLADGRESVPDWAGNHPHLFGTRGKNNALYLASDTLSLPGFNIDLPGGGFFPNLKRPLILTREGCSRCHWSLPEWFHPEGRSSCLSYHERTKRWQRQGNKVHLHSAARGQEFVLNLDHYPEALDWLAELFSCAKHGDTRSTV